MAETVAPFTIARRWNDFLECPQGTARSTAFARAKSFNASPKKYRNKSNNARNIDRESVSIRKFLAADVESIESVGAVGAVFEEVFFRFGKFLAAFVLAETVSAAAYAGCLNGEDKVVVILSVEEWHKALLAGKTLVDEKIFLIVPHGIAEIDRLDSPAVAFKLVDDHPTEVLFVNGIV